MADSGIPVSYEARRRKILNRLDVYYQQVSSIILSKQSVAGLVCVLYLRSNVASLAWMKMVEHEL